MMRLTWIQGSGPMAHLSAVPIGAGRALCGAMVPVEPMGKPPRNTGWMCDECACVLASRVTDNAGYIGI